MTSPHPDPRYHGIEFETTEIHTAEGLIQVIPTSYRALPYDSGGHIPSSAAASGDGIKARIATGEFIFRAADIKNPVLNVAAAFEIAKEKLADLGESMRGFSSSISFATGGLVRSPSAAAEPDPDDDYPAPPPVWDW